MVESGEVKIGAAMHTPTWREVEIGLSIEVRNLGDSRVGSKAAIKSWKSCDVSPFFRYGIESVPAIQGCSLVGFGAPVIVSPEFANHLVLAYIRNHQEEFRPFDWRSKPALLAPILGSTTASASNSNPDLRRKTYGYGK